MIYAGGDSHATKAFEGIAGVKSYYTGPTTLRRAGWAGDDLVPAMVRNLKLTPADTLIFCFGEIDVRMHIPIHAKGFPGGVDPLLQHWVDQYLGRVADLDVGGARCAIMSVVPPHPRRGAPAELFNRDVSDEMRVDYTLRLNRLLEEGCARRGLLYLDVYHEYVDPRGMMLEEFCEDGGTHISGTDRVAALLLRLGLNLEDTPWAVLNECSGQEW